MADPVGKEAVGRAGVFGNSVNPLQYYLNDQAVQQKRADALMEDERKQRDKLIDDHRKWNPDKTWDPFYGEVNDFVQKNVRDEFSRLRNERQPVPAIERRLEGTKAEANSLVAKINWLKEQHKDAMDTVDSEDVGKYYKKNETKRAINDIFFNGRVAKPSAEIDADHIQGVFDNPDNFDVNKISIDFMKSLPEKINQKYTEEFGKYGQQYDVQETKTKLGLQTQKGADGKDYIVLDPRTGLPKVSMTDEVYIQAMADPFLSKVVDKYVPTHATDEQVGAFGGQPNLIKRQKEFLTGLLEGLDPQTIQSRPQMGFRKPDNEIRYNAYGRGFRLPIADLEDRDSRLEKIVTSPHPDLLEGLSDPDSDNQAFYADAKGNKLKPGQKPESIVLARVGTAPPEEEMTPEQIKNMTPAQREEKFWKEVIKGRIIKENVIPIGTPEEKRRAKIAMSLRLDKIDGKRSIGEEYSNYVEAKRQDELKKKPKKGTGAFDNF